MENASKALIIAGAILISILLISLGIMMFNSSKGTTDEAEKTANVLEESAGKQTNSLNEALTNITF